MTITTISTTEFRENFSQVLNRAHYGKEPIIITRRGKPLALLLPVSPNYTAMSLDDIPTLGEPPSLE